jgi:hypothetical protein
MEREPYCFKVQFAKFGWLQSVMDLNPTGAWKGDSLG